MRDPVETNSVENLSTTPSGGHGHVPGTSVISTLAIDDLPPIASS